MDIITLLKKDHRTVDELFTRVEESSARAVKAKQKLFVQIKAELTLHAEAEEAILYPRLQEMASLRHNAMEANEEHRLVKQMLAEIEALEDGGETWDAKMKVLIDMVRHHVEEEEHEIFKTMKSELDSAELKQLGEALEMFKQSAKKKMSAPRRPKSPFAQVQHAMH